MFLKEFKISCFKTFLLQAKPDITAKNKDGATPLDLAAQYDKQGDHSFYHILLMDD